ncbi:hypothetical protein [Nocardia salmonicida]|uniref:hypothetical protein n=1 Tax=Nocardia salmonicida TaxID=53431 RepID=UPI0007A3BBE6|nr:hypothetical protein [Nocardia salmonicida]
MVDNLTALGSLDRAGFLGTWKDLTGNVMASNLFNQVRSEGPQDQEWEFSQKPKRDGFGRWCRSRRCTRR